MSHKIDSPEKCMRFVKRTFGEFFKDMGLNPKYVYLMCALHKDTPRHLHIHFWFAEKEPKCKYRKKQTEYLHKGKISKEAIDKMHVRLNLYITEPHEKLYIFRDEALRALKKMFAIRDIISKDGVKESVLALAKAIPKDASFHYARKDMLPYREQIDRAAKYIKPEIFQTRIKHKANDRTLKRRLAISRRKVSKLFDSFLSSFGGESKLLERDFTNRLPEIEKEMQEERVAQEYHTTQIYGKWDWGK